MLFTESNMPTFIYRWWSHSGKTLPVEGSNHCVNRHTMHSHLLDPRLRAGTGTCGSSRTTSGDCRLNLCNTRPVTKLTFPGELVKAAPGCRMAEGLSQTGLKGRAIAIATLPCRHNKAPPGDLLLWLQPQPRWLCLCIRPCQGRRTKATCMKVLTWTVRRTVSKSLKGLVMAKQTFHVRETL